MSQKSRKEIGAIGESAVAAYLVRRGLTVIGRNIARKTGELDIVAQGPGGLHIVEVKTLGCREFPQAGGRSDRSDRYDPSANLHQYKLHKVARTAEWYVANIGWEGEWQIDGALVWLRERDGRCFIRYLPQIA